MIDHNKSCWHSEEPPPPAQSLLPIVEPVASAHNEVPVRISGRHIHISQGDLDQLYGPESKLTKYRELNQPGQFAAKETLTVVAPRGVIEDVRILGPVRNNTQVEISGTDGYHLGIDPPVRDSGNLEGTPGIVLVGPSGAVTLKQGVILAATHIHMSIQDAAKLDLKNGDRVQVLVDGERDLIFNDVLVRVDRNFFTEMHVDTDEANAAVISDGDCVTIIGKVLLA
jgi:putative phosphotransacetylase